MKKRTLHMLSAVIVLLSTKEIECSSAFDKFYLVGIHSICGNSYNDSETTRNAHAYMGILNKTIDYIRHYSSRFRIHDSFKYVSFDVCNDSKVLAELTLDLTVNPKYYDLKRCLNGIADRDCWKVLAITTYVGPQLQDLLQRLMSNVDDVFLHHQNGVQMGMSAHNPVLNYKTKLFDVVSESFTKMNWQDINIIYILPKSQYIKETKQAFYFALFEELFSHLQKRHHCIKVVSVDSGSQLDIQRFTNLLKSKKGKTQATALICSSQDCREFMKAHISLLDKTNMQIALFTEGFEIGYKNAQIVFHTHSFLIFMNYFIEILESRKDHHILVKEMIYIVKQSSLDIFFIGSSFTMLDYINNIFKKNLYVFKSATLHLKHLQPWQNRYFSGENRLDIPVLRKDRLVCCISCIYHRTPCTSEFYQNSTTTCRLAYCPPGFHVKFGKMRHRSTKWDTEYGEECIICRKGHVKSTYGRSSCIKCSGIYKSNNARTECIDPFLDRYFHFGDIFSVCCITISMAGLILTLCLLSIFVMKRNTPMVKIFDRNLSYIHLLNFLLIFTIAPFVYLGQPFESKCILRICVFAVYYTFNISIVLVKSNKLVDAFLSKTMISKKQILQVNLTQTFIVAINLIIVCLAIVAYFQNNYFGVQFNDESKLYTCHYGYQRFLAGFLLFIHLSSFFQAYRCRKLPRYMSDAWSILYISFISSTTFIVSFPVSYFQNNDMDRIAIDLVVILSNSWITLLLMYGKKLYIMLVHPEKNTSQFFREQQLATMSEKAKRQIGSKMRDQIPAITST